MHPIQLQSQPPLKPYLNDAAKFADPSLSKKTAVEGAEEVEEAFTKFIGSAFFGMMLKSMRESVGKPAYFHGGQAEEIFRSQLDQTLSDEMTKASADQVAGPMFERAFPDQAKLLQTVRAESLETKKNETTLQDLMALRRF